MAEGAAGRRSFLLEVGCEEIPAPMIPKALEDLSAGIVAALGSLASDARVSHEHGGPRRLVALISGIRDREEDGEETVLGPSRTVGFDAQGQPTRAAVGFAKGQGVDLAELTIVGTPKGEVVAARRKIRGRSAAEILAAACPRVLGSLRFGKMMRWGDRGFIFVRPVHWILALLDDDVVPFEFMGVRSGRLTQGHRFLGPGPHEVPRAGAYEGILRERGAVEPRIGGRRSALLDLASREASEAGGRLRPDPDLLEELIFLTEHPAVVRGAFPAEYLALPEAVLITTMRHHQKYLTVEKPDGRLCNAFVAVLTTEPDSDGLVRRGNEWVLRARLADAKFFYEEDQKVPLRERAGDLGRLTFHAKLGSYAQKVRRLRWVLGPAAGLTGAAGVESAEDIEGLREAIDLCKADLTTGMVGEFPELQGVVGGIYARMQGHGEVCARSIEEHYLPVSATGPLPSRGPAAVLALADKIDTLAVCFTAGFIPRGSADPYGLRRAALGVLRILIENGIRANVGRLLDLALEQAASDVAPSSGGTPAAVSGRKGRSGPAFDPRGALHDFVRQRLQFLMEEAGIRFDAARAVLAADWTDPLHAWRRAQALNGLRGEDDFLALAAAAKRVRNILAQAAEKGIQVGERALDPARLGHATERALFEAMREAGREAEALSARGDDRGALSMIASVRPIVDRFFDDVLVMDPDEAVRLNRLTLLQDLSRLLSREADFAEIVVEGESPTR